MHRLLRLVFLITFAASGASAPADPDGAFRAGRFDQALRGYRSRIAQNAGDVSAQTGLIRTLLKQNSIAKAAAAAEDASARLPKDARVLSALGDVQFRRGEFQSAEAAYTKAFQADPHCSRAVLGLGRVALTESRFHTAITYYRSAYALDPDDPEVALVWSETQEHASDEIAALERYLRIAASESPEAITGAKARLVERKALGDEPRNVLEGEARPGVLHTTNLVDKEGINGRALGLEVRLNQARPMTLLLDTGAAGILLDRKAATLVGVKVLAGTEVYGVGDDGPAKASIGILDRLQIGDYVFRNCVVSVVDRGGVTLGKTGIIGTDLFQRFVVSLDFVKNQLRVEPASGDDSGDYDREIPPSEKDFARARRFGHLLLIETTANEKRSGWFILDTGAYRNLFSLDLIRGLTFALPNRSAGSRGFGGSVRSAFIGQTVTLAFGGMRYQNPGAVAFDLSRLSKGVGTEISGMLGRPALEGVVTTIDYRNGLVKFSEIR